MQKLLMIFALAASAVFAQGIAAPRSYLNFWKVSVTALGAANAMDIHSSWGKHELNSALAGPNGNFGAQGALIKLAMQGSLIGIEYLLTRHRPSAKMYRALGIINFGAATGIAGVAARNYSIPR
jgi:hypothetical protein